MELVMGDDARSLILILNNNNHHFHQQQRKKNGKLVGRVGRESKMIIIQHSKLVNILNLIKILHFLRGIL